MNILSAEEPAINHSTRWNNPDSNKERKLLLPEKSETSLEVVRYLTGRGIDREIIKDCIDEGLLYESVPYHNCIFVGYDEAGVQHQL